MNTFYASDGLKLAYELDDFTDPWKSSETVVLVHAAMGSSRRLQGWVPQLMRDFRVVRPDLRGHGDSAIPGPAQLSFPRLVTDVVDLLDHLGCKQAHLAGSSAGAIVAQQVAIDHPHRVLSLGLFAAAPGLKTSNADYAGWVASIRDKGVRRFLADTITDRFDPTTAEPGFIDWFLDESARNSAELLARFVPMMSQVDTRPDLSRIRCPTLAVAPGKDPIHPISHYEIVRDGIPGCELVVFDGLAHNITDSVPDRCARELHRFLIAQR